MGSEREGTDRKPYVQPRVLFTEKMQARAVSCASGTDAQCGAGPINS
jgi:hypothetical protein